MKHETQSDPHDALPLDSVHLAFKEFLGGQSPPTPMAGLSEQATRWTCKWIIDDREFEIGVSLDSSPDERWWWTMKNVPRGAMRGDILDGRSLMTALLWQRGKLWVRGIGDETGEQK